MVAKHKKRAYVSTRSGEEIAHTPPEKPNKSHHIARHPRVMVRYPPMSGPKHGEAKRIPEKATIL